MVRGNTTRLRHGIRIGNYLGKSRTCTIIHGARPMWWYRATVIDRCLNSKYRLVRVRRVHKIIDRLKRIVSVSKKQRAKRAYCQRAIDSGTTC